MPNDALDPGGDGSYPHLPRREDGTVDPERFPTGVRYMRHPRTGERIAIDVTPEQAREPGFPDLPDD